MSKAYWSSIPKQTLLVEDGKVGDCWRCCIAAILGIPASDVPHFAQIQSITHKNSFEQLAQEWLNERGLWLVTAGYLHFPATWEREHELPPIIAVGPSPRSTKMHQHHAVVMVEGDLVYDPHPSNAGLTAITGQYFIGKHPHLTPEDKQSTTNP